MAKIVYRQMPAPRELSQQIPAPRAKARMQKPHGGGKFLVQIPGVRGGMVMDEIDTCIRYARKRGQHCTWHVAQTAQHLGMWLVECHLLQVQKSNTQDSDWCVKVGVILLC